MQISMKCSLAVHCLIFIRKAESITKVTSTLLAQSTGSNPVIIRNILSALKKAGIITVAMGPGGARLCDDPRNITLYRIYTALEPRGLSSLIDNRDCKRHTCPVAGTIGQVLKTQYEKIADAVRRTMENITLEEMLVDFRAKCPKNALSSNGKEPARTGNGETV